MRSVRPGERGSTGSPREGPAAGSGGCDGISGDGAPELRGVEARHVGVARRLGGRVSECLVSECLVSAERHLLRAAVSLPSDGEVFELVVDGEGLLDGVAELAKLRLSYANSAVWRARYRSAARKSSRISTNRVGCSSAG